MSGKVVVATYDAVGGPRTSGMAGDGHVAGPTDEGNFVLSHCGKHSSSRYPEWSRIQWGSELKESNGKLLVHHEGKWRALGDLTTVTKADTMKYHLELYGRNEVPKRWLFNDFGHMTCKYFRDSNKNRKMDTEKGETIHGEFLHTTPTDEADSALGRAVQLVESHGCIHIKPNDIDEMYKKQYLKKGNLVVVHRYDESLPAMSSNPKGAAPFEIHFYPGKKKILILGTGK
jgi:hypothetical protein